MAGFAATDGTVLAYRRTGAGRPLICVPGGPMRAAAYYGAGAFDPAGVRAGLRGVAAPVLIVAGERDMQLAPEHAREYAACFPRAEVAVAPGAGHFPWLDDTGWFAGRLGGWSARNGAIRG